VLQHVPFVEVYSYDRSFLIRSLSWSRHLFWNVKSMVCRWFTKLDCVFRCFIHNRS